MNYLIEWKIFESIDNNVEKSENRFWKVKQYLTDTRYKNDYLRCKIVLNDIIVDGDFEEEFFVYCQSLKIFLIFTKVDKDYFITDWSESQNSKPMKFTPLKWTIYTSHAKKMKSQLDDMENISKYYVDNVKGKSSKITIKNKDISEIPEFDMSIEKLNKDFRESLKKEYIGTKLLFDMGSNVFYKPGKKIWIVQPFEITVEDIEVYLLPYLESVIFVTIYCESPFGQKCRIRLDANSPTEQVDIEEDVDSNLIVMLPMNKTNKYPYSSSFLLSPLDYNAIEFCKNIVELLDAANKGKDEDEDDGYSSIH